MIKLNIFSYILIFLLVFFALTSKSIESLTDKIFSLFIIMTLITNNGFFISVSDNDIAYGEVLQFVLLVLLLFINRHKDSKVFLKAFLFFLVVTLGEIILISFPPKGLFVLLDGGSWDRLLYGYESMSYAYFRKSNLIRFIRVLFFIILILKLKPYLKISKINFRRLFNIAGWLFVLIGYADFIFKNIFGSTIIGTLALSIFGVSESQVTDVLFQRAGVFQVVGLFREPSAFSAVGGLPLILYLVLLNSLSKKEILLKYLLAILVTLSGSLTGIIILIEFFIFNYIKDFKKRANSINISFIFLCIPIFLFLCYKIYSTKLVQYNLERLSNIININNQGVSSEVIRRTSVLEALKDFYARPYVGLGIGTSNYHGFLPSLLANIGIFGFITYVSFISTLFEKGQNKKYMYTVFILLMPILIMTGDIGWLYNEVTLIILIIIKKTYEINEAEGWEVNL